MNKPVEVKLWGTLIGYLGYAPGQSKVATFEFVDRLINSPIDISPIKMPNRQNLHEFPEDSYRTFKGVPGIFADSLPDKFGSQLIDIYMAEKGRSADSVTTLDRLLYVGDHGVGALEYHPAESLTESPGGDIALDIPGLAELASKVIRRKQGLADELHDIKSKEQAIKLLRVGSSAGGARAKALVAKSQEGKLYDGTVDHGLTHTYWLLKFDSEENSDRDSKDPKGMTRVEYIYSLLARECDINIPNTDFIDTGNDFHFMIERFDRIARNGRLDKLHYGSWCGLAHAHRDNVGVYSYEQLVLHTRQMGLGQDAVTELFKRAMFNILGRNQDDHSKNFGYLMDRTGTWSLSPAFDMTYSYDPTGKWTKTHQIRLNRKSDNFTLNDLLAFGKYCNLSEKKAHDIIKTTGNAFSKFTSLADKYEVPGSLKSTVLAGIRDI